MKRRIWTFTDLEQQVLRRALRLSSETDYDTGPALLGISRDEWEAVRGLCRKFQARDPGPYPDEVTTSDKK